MDLVQLSRAEHGSLRVDPRLAGAAAANVHLVPLVRSELRRACAHHPVFFAKDAETGRFYPAALMGLEPYENLRWDGGALDTGYVPLNLLRLPFYIGGDDDGVGGAVCVDMDSPGVNADDGRVILEHDGRDSAYMTSIHAILTELAAQHEVTRAFVDQALGFRLIQEVTVDIVFRDDSAAQLAGLYGVDERALAREAARIDDFDDVIAMSAVIVSLEHVAGLVELRNARIADEAAWLGRTA